MSEEAWEYLTKLRELPFDRFLEWRLLRDRKYLMQTARESGRRGRAQAPKEPT